MLFMKTLKALSVLEGIPEKWDLDPGHLEMRPRDQDPEISR